VDPKAATGDGDPTKGGAPDAVDPKATGDGDPTKGGTIVAAEGCNIGGYAVSAVDVNAIMAATDPGSVCGELRARLYAAVFRRKNSMSPTVLAEWSACENKAAKFSLLQKTLADTSVVGTITVSESFSKKETKRVHDRATWTTKAGLFTQYDAWEHPRKRKYCESLCAAAKVKKFLKLTDPVVKDDPDFNIEYKVNMNKGETKSVEGSSMQNFEGSFEVTDGESRKLALDIASGITKVQMGALDAPEAAVKSPEEIAEAKLAYAAAAKGIRDAKVVAKEAAKARGDVFVRDDAIVWLRRLNTDASKVRKSMVALKNTKNASAHAVVLAGLQSAADSCVALMLEFEELKLSDDTVKCGELKVAGNATLEDIKVQLEAAHKAVRAK
jgi:hypothetical protein